MTTPPKDAYDSIADLYDTAFQDAKSQAEDGHVWDHIIDNGYTHGNVLDLGCGTGLLLDWGRIAPDRYLGVDVSNDMLRKARAKHPDHTFTEGDMANLETVGDSSVDNVLCLFGSFSYSMNPVDVIDEIHRVLRPGGRFMLMAYGRRYDARKSCLLNRTRVPVLRMPYTAGELGRLFKRFRDTRITGMSALGDYLPEWVSQRFYRQLHRFEEATIGRLLPNVCHFLVVEGAK